LDYLTTHTSLSPIRRGFAPGFLNYKKGCTRLAAVSHKAYQLLSHGLWFFPGTPVSTETGRHDIAESGVNHNKSINQPEKLATRRRKQNKSTTQYVFDTTIHKQTNNVKKTCALLQTSRGKDDPNVVFMRKS
jgi:hypothetical protein